MVHIDNGNIAASTVFPMAIATNNTINVVTIKALLTTFGCHVASYLKIYLITVIYLPFASVIHIIGLYTEHIMESFRNKTHIISHPLVKLR